MAWSTGGSRWALARTAVAVAVVTVVMGGVGAGCSSGGGGDSPFDRQEATATTTTIAAAQPRPMELLWSTRDVSFASRPVLVGDRLVAYVAVDGGMKLAAFNVTTGVEVWRRDSTASLVTKGVGIAVTANDRHVFLMTPRDGEVAAIEAIDVATGDPVWITEGAQDGFTDVLEFCPDSTDQLCVGAADTDVGSLWRIDAASGAVTRTDGFAGRELAVGLYDLRGDGDEQVSRVVDGQVTWQRPPNELFQGRDVTSDNGWHWQEHDGLLVGWLGARQEWPETGELAFVPQYMAGVDAATGETRWVTEGAPTCGPRLWGMTLRVDGAEPWIRCRMTGSYQVEGGDIVGTVVTNAVIEGFDPATGATTWSVELGAASALSDDTKPLVRLGPTSFTLVRDDGTRLGVDVETGQALDVPDDSIGWCIGTNEFAYVDGTDRPVRYGEDFTTPCDLGGTRRPVPAAPDEALGAHADGRFAWVDEAGLHTAREAP